MLVGAQRGLLVVVVHFGFPHSLRPTLSGSGHAGFLGCWLGCGTRLPAHHLISCSAVYLTLLSLCCVHHALCICHISLGRGNGHLPILHDRV